MAITFVNIYEVASFAFVLKVVTKVMPSVLYVLFVLQRLIEISHFGKLKCRIEKSEDYKLNC